MTSDDVFFEMSRRGDMVFRRQLSQVLAVIPAPVTGLVNEINAGDDIKCPEAKLCVNKTCVDHSGTVCRKGECTGTNGSSKETVDACATVRC
eukprot:CAMPEP_0172484572 /NCGR_PEP_ID=MMETSP1066-20121228/12090_1 /TAXON_ID=671091 /ORGANISM="Coscinodiscus wailesii, Strain CCMP2513" /LENGTH=91 /DNA_ID=CAMNT_0013249191 /DNA_START=79 /DNA_END=351 /DNA_ORIENTATION=+